MITAPRCLIGQRLVPAALSIADHGQHGIRVAIQCLWVQDRGRWSMLLTGRVPSCGRSRGSLASRSSGVVTPRIMVRAEAEVHESKFASLVEETLLQTSRRRIRCASQEEMGPCRSVSVAHPSRVQRMRLRAFIGSETCDRPKGFAETTKDSPKSGLRTHEATVLLLGVRIRRL